MHPALFKQTAGDRTTSMAADRLEQVTLIVGHVEPSQELAVFLLESLSLVMLCLVLDVADDIGQSGRSSGA
jgi:hypothetical protein